MNFKQPITPKWDPWDVWQTRSTKGKYELTSIEFTLTNLCNLRCEHCAVGEQLVEKEGLPLSVDFLIQRLEEIPHLQTISFTGGEPVLNRRMVKQTLQPLLKYAKSRGIYTQINTNLTLPLSYYEDWIEDIDVVHISYNYRNVDDFYRITFHHVNRDVSKKTAEKLFEQMKENARTFSKQGIFVSAESFLSPFTSQHIETIHQQIAEIGCKRHEVHPLYPSDFAKGMKLLSLAEYRQAVYTLIHHRDPKIWILFGTFPFFPCSNQKEDHDLLLRLHQEPLITIRQDPDGRNRLNVNAFTGDVYVTDFDNVPPLGNIKNDRLQDVFARWLQSPTAKQYHCYCPNAHCTGPNVIVANTYYRDWVFTNRKAKIAIEGKDE